MATIVRLAPHLTEHLSTLRSQVSYWNANSDQSDAGEPRSRIWIERLPTVAEWTDNFVNDLANR